MRKTKVLGLVHGGFSSHTVRVLEIAKAMRETGRFDITFSGQGPFMKLVEDAEFNWIETKGLALKEILEKMDKFVPRFFSREAIEELFPIEEALLQENKPDMVMRDYFRELAGIAAKKQGIFDVLIGYANVCPYYNFDFNAENVPKIMDYVEWSLQPLGGLQTIIRNKVGRELHRKSKKLGFKIDKTSYEGVHPNLVLLTDSKITFPLPNKPSFYKHTGPLLVLNQDKAPDWEKDFAQDEREKIVISCGSTGRHEKTDVLVKAFQDTEFAIAFNTQDAPDKIPKNFYGRGPFEINSVLSYADVFIHHGGIGSTYLGLRHGLPMLGIYNHWEQQVNCFAVDAIGAGLSIGQNKRTPKIVRGKTHQLIYNPKYKACAIQVKEALKREQLKHGSALERAVKYIDEGYAKFRRNSTKEK